MPIRPHHCTGCNARLFGDIDRDYCITCMENMIKPRKVIVASAVEVPQGPVVPQESLNGGRCELNALAALSFMGRADANYEDYSTL